MDDTRNLPGRIAQVGVWNSVLDSTKIAALAAGDSPFKYRTNLLWYFRGNSGLLAYPNGTTGTADGTTQLTGVGNGPTITY